MSRTPDYRLLKVTGSEDASGPKYTAQYSVKTYDKFDGPYTITSNSPIKLGDKFWYGNDYDPRAIALSATPTLVEGHQTRWLYSIEYGVAPERDFDNPLRNPPIIELSFAASEKLLEKDVNGKPIRNTVGDRFDDVITREDSQPILRIKRNEKNAMYGVDLRDTVNRSPWNGAPRRTVKFQPPTLTSKHHARIGTYYEKSYEFKYSDDTWRFLLLNQGYYIGKESKSGGFGTGAKEEKYIQRIRILDSEGEPITAPAALTEKGGIIGPKDKEHYIEFDGYREAQFPRDLEVSL